MNFNQIILAGHLVRDPELTYTSNQTPIANFDIAVNYKRGEREETCFVHCVAFGNMAETIVKYFVKGKPIFVVGRLTQDRWQTEDGSNRSRIKITVTEFKFVESSKNSSLSDTGNTSQDTSQNTSSNPGLQKDEGDVFK